MIHYAALSTDIVRAYQSGASDDYGLPPESAVSDGGGNPCRHCLREIPKGDSFLILAHRPFEGLHPYAETGPIFLCAAHCDRYAANEAIPPILLGSPEYLIKGYSAQDRIVYGTGAIVALPDLPGKAETTFENSSIAYIHARSARNNCYLLRIDRG